mgnify:CR=1 FL=1
MMGQVWNIPQIASHQFFLLKIGTITVKCIRCISSPTRHPHFCELVVYVYDCMHYVLQGNYFWRNCIFKSDFQNQEFRSLTNYLCSIYMYACRFKNILWHFIMELCKNFAANFGEIVKTRKIYGSTTIYPSVPKCSNRQLWTICVCQLRHANY